MRTAISFGLLAALASCRTAPPPPAARAVVPSTTVADAGMPAVVVAPPPAPASHDEPALAWGTRPNKDGPLFPVVDGMCVHGEVWLLEDGALFSYGNATGGYSRGGSTTLARFVDDGIDETDLWRTVDPKASMTGFSPFRIDGRWPGPLVAHSEDYGGSRTGEGTSSIWAHDAAGWKLLASHSRPDGEAIPNYDKPILFRDHVIIPRLSHGPDGHTSISYRAVPPLAGIAALNHDAEYEKNQLAASDDAIYAVAAPAKYPDPPSLREWRDGKAKNIATMIGVSRIVLTRPTVVLAGGRTLAELVNGKLEPIDPSYAKTLGGITTVSVAPNGDLWIAESTHKAVIVAKRGADGRHTTFETLALPPPTTPRPEDENLHSAENGGHLAGVELEDPYAIGPVGTLFHREGDAWKEVIFPKPPWATNRYRAQTIAMRAKGDLYVNAGYGEKGAGWATPERYRAILRTKRPREVLRCNEPTQNHDYASGEGFMSFPPLADDACKTPFVIIVRTAWDVRSKTPTVAYTKTSEFPGVRESIKATPALGEHVELVELTSGNQRYLGAAVPTTAVGRDFIAALAKRLKLAPEIRPEIVCGQPKPDRTLMTVDVTTGNFTRP